MLDFFTDFYQHYHKRKKSCQHATSSSWLSLSYVFQQGAFCTFERLECSVHHCHSLLDHHGCWARLAHRWSTRGLFAVSASITLVNKATSSIPHHIVLSIAFVGAINHSERRRRLHLWNVSRLLYQKECISHCSHHRSPMSITTTLSQIYKLKKNWVLKSSFLQQFARLICCRCLVLPFWPYFPLLIVSYELQQYYVLSTPHQSYSQLSYFCSSAIKKLSKSLLSSVQVPRLPI